jgi:signal transduction histidine kinase/DNA-binding response OmpR family regulator
MTDPKVSILIVDDRPEKLLALEAVLEDLGENIVRAYSGREALRQVLTQEFAVILLDVNMPDMDGFETAALIRQRKSSEHVPIIFITAMGDEMHVSRGYSLGAVDYILTPVVPEVLRSKVAVFVDLFRKTQQVRRQADSLRRRAGQLQKLAAAAVAINGALSIDRMLQTITETARDLVGSHQAITLYCPDELAAAAGGPAPASASCKTASFASFSDKYADWRGEPLDLDVIAETSVARSRTPTRLSESELHEHPDWETVRGAKIPPIVGGILAAPLSRRDGGRLGVIYVADRQAPGPFSHDDEALIVQLAQMASIAIENTLFAQERETNRIKDEFLSTLSHELRTPLNAILGWTQLLRMENLDGEAGHGLDVIERNVRAQTKLIEDLLDVSRISTGKLRLSVSPTPIAPVVQAALDACRPMADAKQIRVEADLSPTAGRIAGDPDRLQQVVWNLLSNAIKFTPPSGRVEVQLSRSGGTVEIRVTDSGPGIDAKFLPYVFDRFRQADSTSTRQHGGLGIGLTIVRHIVELHGGLVTAESPGSGHGATFRVRLPVPAGLEDEVSSDKPASTPERLARSRGSGSSGGKNGKRVAAVASPAVVRDDASANALSPDRLTGLSVLVVDDEADAREIVSEVLRRAGATVRSAGSSQEAIESFDRDRPDVLLSDIAMPDEDGYSLIQRLRRHANGSAAKLPAIALTAYAREEDRARALAAGFQLHLSKPAGPHDLVDAVARLAGDLSQQQASLRLSAG